MPDPTFLSDDEIILAEFADETQTALAGMDQLFVSLEQAPADMNTVNAIFRPIHSLKANSAFLGLMNLKALAHATESILDGIRKHDIPADRGMIDLLLKSVDELKAITSRIRNKQQEVEDPAMFKNLLDRLVAAKSGQVPPPSTSPTPTPTPAPANAAVATPAAHPPEATPGTRTMRVAVESIDALSLVTEELAHVQAELNRVAQGPDEADTANPLHAQIRSINQQFDAVLARIRQGLSSIRKVPLLELLQKVPRLVRDTATNCNKQAVVRITGENILVSRELVQLMDAPLVHLIRNSVDHGAESPEERAKAGKPPECVIAIQAVEQPGELIIKISDDGRGIDIKMLLLKALKVGAVKAGQQLRPEDMLNLIFLPGVSTAKQITDVSGRGMGMDIVKDSVVKLGGKITVSSTLGLGVEFTIVLPNP